ncbi:MAG: gfo/Idh/MocA family oxidoreductase, partial [Verrucomicrobiae bacterium]|nr:gfo/Idh/MocA family oxidoreductase [Verrucomicrobiae bacterium]
LIGLQTGPRLLPSAKFKGYPKPKLEPRNHYHHFVDACLGGQMTESHFQQTAPMTEAILLGTVAVRVPDTLLRWDSHHLRITNSTDANKLLRRRYRKGWQIHGL